MNASWIAPALLLALGGPLFAQSFPFPRSADPRFAYAKSGKPDGGPAKLDRAVVEYYEAWRARFLVTITHAELREIEPGSEQAFVNVNADDPGVKKDERFRSVSEGHGYGMLIAVLMAGHPHRPPGAPADREQRDFDALYRFFRAHPSVPDAKEQPDLRHPNLMAFQVQGRDLARLMKARPDEDSDSASDGDMDIAYALLLAERQWGHAGEIKYGDEARKVIADIEKFDVNRSAATVKLGDSFEAEDEEKFFAVRTSDFMPQHWRAFAQAGERALWEQVIAKSLAIEASSFAKFAAKTGLMSDFLVLPPDAKPAPGTYRPPIGCLLEKEKGDGNWSYNACRTPWRLATDYLVTGDPGTADQLKKLNAWMQTQATRGGELHPDQLNAGYTLAGEKLPVEDNCDEEKDGKKKSEPRPVEFEPAGSCFLAPLAVSAMLPGSHDWLNALWTHLTPEPNPAEEPYFDCTVKLLCMITISGNWWDPTRAKRP